MLSSEIVLAPFAERLKKAGVDKPWREVRLMAARLAECSYEEIWTGQKVFPPSKMDQLDRWVHQREMHRPLTKILQCANFWKYTFLTTEDTLDPRPESELFIDEILRAYPDRRENLSFLDLGTGTGCIVLSCLGEYPNARGIAVDISERALNVAKKNTTGLSAKHGLDLDKRITFLQSCWLENVNGKFDIVVCNPPYIADSTPLPPEVLYDPPTALFGGPDGYNAYRCIFEQLPAHLHNHSRVFVEIGLGQDPEVQRIANSNGLVLERKVLDLQHIPRLLVLSYIDRADL